MKHLKLSQKALQTPSAPVVSVPQPPKIVFEVSAGTPEPLAKRILQDLSEFCARKKFWKDPLEAPVGFETLATSIFDTFGANSDIWRLFTRVLCPIGLWDTLGQGLADKTLSLADYMKASGKVTPPRFYELQEALATATKAVLVTQAQKQASLRRKEVIPTVKSLGAVEIAIDRPKGFIQLGIDASGTPWTRTYACDYGYFPGTQGGDGEALDVYVGELLESANVYLIEQITCEGKFDEWKVMVGFPSEIQAKAAYLAHTPEQFFSALYSYTTADLDKLIHANPVDTYKKHHPMDWKVSVKSLGDPNSHYVLGVVLAPEEFDLHKEIYGHATIEDAAHHYMENYRRLGVQHAEIIVKGTEGVAEGCPATIVESYISPVDWELNGQKIPKGSWLLGTKIYDPDLWGKISRGEITAYSMGGYVKGRPELPPPQIG